MIEKTNIQVLAGPAGPGNNQWIIASQTKLETGAGHSTANSALLLYFITKDLLVQLLCHQKLREGSICKLLDFYIFEQLELPRLQTGLQSSVKQRSVNIMLFLSDIWNPILLQGQTLIGNI